MRKGDLVSTEKEDKHFIDMVLQNILYKNNTFNTYCVPFVNNAVYL